MPRVILLIVLALIVGGIGIIIDAIQLAAVIALALLILSFVFGSRARR